MCASLVIKYCGMNEVGTPIRAFAVFPSADLIDSLELERTAARLSRELTSSQEAEGSLRAQLEELSSLRTLPDQVDHLTKRASRRTFGSGL